MKYRILVVEDTQRDFEYLRDRLAQESYEILHAPTGHQGLRMLEENAVDLVVLDIMLPDLDGFELCKRIRQDERFASLPVLFYTSSDTIDNRLLGLQLGASDFLVKGGHDREMLLRIRNMLSAKKLFDEMVKLSVIDGLTHVYNRRYFQHRLMDEFERGRRYNREFCCVIVDVDHFKEVNDTHGHPAGDVVLKQVAAYLRRNTRASDVLCRYGGDEFGLLLPETEIQGAYVTAERIRVMIEKADFGGPQYKGLKVSVSSGISSLMSHNAMGMDELVTQADVALYQAKRIGRNRVMVYGQQPGSQPPVNTTVIQE